MRLSLASLSLMVFDVSESLTKWSVLANSYQFWVKVQFQHMVRGSLCIVHVSGPKACGRGHQIQKQLWDFAYALSSVVVDSFVTVSNTIFKLYISFSLWCEYNIACICEIFLKFCVFYKLFSMWVITNFFQVFL